MIFYIVTISKLPSINRGYLDKFSIYSKIFPCHLVTMWSDEIHKDRNHDSQLKMAKYSYFFLKLLVS